MNKILFFVLLVFVGRVNAQVCFNPAVYHSAGPQPGDIISADFNGDGKVDYAIHYGYSVSYDINAFINDGNGNFSGWDIHFSTYAKTIVAGDFNNDGLDDIAAVIGTSSTLSVFLSNGYNGFGSAINLSISSNDCIFKSGYLDGDANLDLIAWDYTTTQLCPLYGLGTGGFAFGGNISGSFGNLPVIGDFNIDGNQDLVVANANTIKNVSVLLGDGVGGFVEDSFAIGPISGGLISADFNGDSFLDLTAFNGNSLNTISLLFGTGTGSFSSLTSFSVSSGTYNLGESVDFDGDNKMDLITLFNSNQASIFLGDGTGGFQPPSFFTVGFIPNSGANSLICVNLNSDPRPDFAVCNGFINNVAVLLNCTFIQNAVWPGDADENLIVNNLDLFSIGTQYGKTGQIRFVQGNAWDGDTCINWTDTLSNGKNCKYADCNGDGIIDMNDTLAINLNYGLTHVARNGHQLIQTANPDVYLQFNKVKYLAGDTVVADVLIGSNTIPQTNFYGAAFNLTYDNSKVQSGTEKFWFNNSWVGNINTSKIKLSRINTGTGIVDASLVRITHTDTGGFGKVATLQFILKTGLSNSEMYFTINNAIKTDSAGNISPLNTGTDSTEIVSGTTVVQSVAGSKQLSVYPNPTTNKIIVQSSTELGSIVIYNSLGEIVFQTKSKNTIEQIDLSKLSSGVYTLQAQGKFLKLVKE